MSLRTHRLLFVLAALLTAQLSACAGKQKTELAAVPAVPVPPREPWAWLPEDGTFVGQLVLEPFRATPLWTLWENARKDQRALGALIDPEKIERAQFSGVGRGQETPSFVAALTGQFAEGGVAAAALRQNIPAEKQGLLTVYRYEQVAVAQVYPELIVACSLDKLPWLAARSSEGPAVKVKESALYRSLAGRVAMDSADFAVIAEDPSGDAKAVAERQAQRYGLAVAAADLVRGGVSLDLGPTTQLGAVVETTGPQQAEALKGSAEVTLAGLSNNIFVGLLGVKPLITALRASSDGNYVAVGGGVPMQDLNGALDRLAGMLGVAMSGNVVAAP